MQQLLDLVYPKDPTKVYDRHGKCFTIIHQGYSPDLQRLAPDQSLTDLRDDTEMQIFESSTGIILTTDDDNVNQQFTNAEKNNLILVNFSNEDKNGDIPAGATAYSILTLHSLLNLNTSDALAKDCKVLQQLMDSWKYGECTTGDYAYTLLLKGEQRYIFAHCNMKITEQAGIFTRTFKAQASSEYIIFFISKRF